MLFTPSPPLSSQSVSSSVGSESPSIQTASIFNTRDVENLLHTESLSNNTILVTNGPSNNQLLSTSQSHFSQLFDQDYFYSPFSSSSSSRPSIHLTPTKTTPTNIKLSETLRFESCPVSPVNKKINHRLHFPTSIISSIRDVLMASLPTTDHKEDISHLSKTNQWSNNTIMPVANPAAAAALVEDNELISDEEQLAKSVTSSPLDTPKNSDHLHRSPTDYSTNVHSHNANTNRKVVLNVGGVRHESNLFIYSFKKENVFSYSFMAYTFSSTKYTSRSFSKIT
jgi:hypothetical protein